MRVVTRQTPRSQVVSEQKGIEQAIKLPNTSGQAANGQTANGQPAHDRSAVGWWGSRDEYLTIVEVQQIVFGGRVGLSTLYSRATAGELPGAVRFGRRFLVHRATLETWLKDQATNWKESASPIE